MATTRRPSGITVETNGAVALAEGDRPLADDSGPVLTPPRPGRRRGRPGRGGARRAPGPRTQALPNEADVIAQALVDRNLKLMDTVPFQAARSAGGRRRPGRRRRAGGAEGPAEATLVGTATLDVPLEPDERAVILLEQDGVYSWHMPHAEAGVAGEDESPAGKRKRKGSGKRKTRKGSNRVAHFRLEIAPVSAPQPKPSGKRKFGFIRKIIGKAVAYVFKVIAKPVLKAVAKWLERDVAEGLVHITGTDPALWTRDGDQTVPIPDGKAPRILLFVHGTFSSTLGSFGSLGATVEGKAFLNARLPRP